MPKFGFALPGAVAALAFGVLTVTTAVAQQNAPSSPAGAAPEAGTTAQQPRSESRDRDDDERRGRDFDGGRRDGWDRDHGDSRDHARERWRRWREEGSMRRRDRDDDRDGGGYGRRGGDDWRGRWRERRGDDGPRESGMDRGRRGGGMMGSRGMGRLCGPGGERMMGFMLDRLERITQPTDAQKPAFDKVKEAAAKARETVKAGCPNGPPPITMTGRLAAAEKRLEALLAAVRLVRQPLDEYYGTLSEEQKARLYMARERGGRDHFEERRDRGGERQGPDDGRRGPRDGERDRSREDRREGLNYRDGERGPEYGDAFSDTDRDGWLDDWRGRS